MVLHTGTGMQETAIFDHLIYFGSAAARGISSSAERVCVTCKAESKTESEGIYSRVLKKKKNQKTMHGVGRPDERL